MATVTTRKDVFDQLIRAGNKPSVAGPYADMFVEYRIAQENIERLGAVVADARTGAAAPNPFLTVRDRALLTLSKLRKDGAKADCLWT